jgi:hypothetical protein
MVVNEAILVEKLVWIKKEKIECALKTSATFKYKNNM